MKSTETMTEAKWLACSDPQAMLDHLETHDLQSDRKQRLHDCACVRRIWHLLQDASGRRAVETAEAFADGLATLEELREAQGVVLAAADAIPLAYSSSDPPDHRVRFAAYTVLCAAAGAAWEFRSGAKDPLGRAADAIAREALTGTGPSERRIEKKKRADERAKQAALVRDIFGNPFRLVAVRPEWPTPAVINLSRVIYDDRAFDHLPMLADALEDAGCDEPNILDHCRQPGDHVRGCWVVDVVLGRQ
jgi:hypothetical protein